MVGPPVGVGPAVGAIELWSPLGDPDAGGADGGGFDEHSCGDHASWNSYRSPGWSISAWMAGTCGSSGAAEASALSTGIPAGAPPALATSRPGVPFNMQVVFAVPAKVS